MDIEQEFLILSKRIHTFLGQQKTWNEQHDKRSKETLDTIKNTISTTSNVITELQLQVQNTKYPCDARKAEIVSATEVCKAKTQSLEKRVKWLWIAFSGLSITIMGSAASIVFKEVVVRIFS